MTGYSFRSHADVLGGRHVTFSVKQRRLLGKTVHNTVRLDGVDLVED